MRLISCVLLPLMIAGCAAAVGDPPVEANASQSSDTLAPMVECSPPHVTEHGEGEASSIICETVDPQAPGV